MKIRIKSNTIRLRLSQLEVDSLANDSEVWDSCQFASSILSYGVRPVEGGTMNAEFEGDRILVSIPGSMLKNWDKDDRVGFDFHMTNGTYLLVEKDFKCLIDREHEDETNLYPNPNSQQS